MHDTHTAENRKLKLVFQYGYSSETCETCNDGHDWLSLLASLNNVEINTFDASVSPHCGGSFQISYYLELLFRRLGLDVCVELDDGCDDEEREDDQDLAYRVRVTTPDNRILSLPSAWSSLVGLTDQDRLNLITVFKFLGFEVEVILLPSYKI